MAGGRILRWLTQAFAFLRLRRFLWALQCSDLSRRLFVALRIENHPAIPHLNREYARHVLILLGQFNYLFGLHNSGPPTAMCARHGSVVNSCAEAPCSSFVAPQNRFIALAVIRLFDP